MKLTYFDIDGGRAEAARMAFFAGDIAFEDERISFQDFAKLRHDYPYAAVPVFEVDGHVVSQSVAISRYAGIKSGFYPTDPTQQLFCDEVMSVVENATQIFGPSMKAKDPEQIKAMRLELVDGYLSTFIKGLGKTLEKRGGKYFSDGRLTVADFAVYSWMNWQMSGMIDHVPKTLIKDLAPNLMEYHERMSAEKAIAGYYQMRKEKNS